MRTWDYICLYSWVVPVFVLLSMILLAMFGVLYVPSLATKNPPVDGATYVLLAVFVVTFAAAVILRAVVLQRRIAKLREEYRKIEREVGPYRLWG
jgi:TRAP-type C4-dicarboxylate transport system permease small subunit